MNAIIFRRMSHVRCGTVFPFREISMGLVSDACVATHARSTGVDRLAGRPGPHGRRSLQTADAAYGMSHSSSRGEVFPYGLAWQSQAQHM